MAKRTNLKASIKPSVVYPFDDPAGEALIGKHFGFFTDADFDETDESLIGWYYRKNGTQFATHKYWAGPFPTSSAAREAQQADPQRVIEGPRA